MKQLSVKISFYFILLLFFILIKYIDDDNLTVLYKRNIYKYYVFLRNMEIMGKISKGSKMDQVYISKNRRGFEIGSYVIIKPLEEGEQILKKIEEKLYFYNVNYIEPLKVEIINRIMEIIDKNMKDYQNIIITGSFLNKGFNFNDIDIIFVSKEKADLKNTKIIGEIIEEKIKIKIHMIILNNKSLINGLLTDPLYELMLSRCVSKKRLIYKIKYKLKNKINYKILDLHLLKSKILIDNFDMLNGNEKYYLIRNMITIFLYLEGKKISNDKVDFEIKKQFSLDTKEIKQNMIQKNDFLKKYKFIYNKASNKIMAEIKKQTNKKTNKN